MCLLATCISLEKCLFRSFAPIFFFKFNRFHFFIFAFIYNILGGGS